MKFCPSCKREYADGRFCLECGSALTDYTMKSSQKEEVTCSKCGETNREGWKFCRSCQAKNDSDKQSITIGESPAQEITSKTPGSNAINLPTNQYLPQDCEELINRGNGYAEEKEWNNAIRDFQEALRLNQRDFTPYIRILDCLQQQEKWSDMREFILSIPRGIFGSTHERLSIDYFKAMALQRTDNMQDAKDILMNIVHTECSEFLYTADSHIMLSFIFLSEENQNASKKHLDLALENHFCDLATVKLLISNMTMLSPDDRSQYYFLTIRNNIYSIILARIMLAEATEFELADDCESKIANAKRSFVRLAPDERLVCLYDSTVFQNGKGGVALSDWTIYWKIFLDPAEEIDYANISEISIDTDDVVYIKGKRSIIISDSDSHLLYRILSEIIDYIDFSRSLVDY